MVDVYLNDKYVGRVSSAVEFTKKITEERRKGVLPTELNFKHDTELNEVYLNTTKGRARRPLIVVENAKSKLTDEYVEDLKSGKIKWDKLVRDGIIEYLDAAEEENIYIAEDENALTTDHTHLEIGALTILGLCTSLIPYSNFGGSSRLIRGSKIQKQGLGMFAANYLLRLNTDSSVMYYPQLPITKTFMHDLFQYNNGQNIVLAVMSYEGYNMEDAVIMNKSSVDRGLFRSTYFKPFSTEEVRYQGGLTDEIGIPDKEIKGYKMESDYKFLEDDGIVYLGAKLGPEDVLVGKTSPPRFLGEFEEFSVAANTKRESSVALNHREKGLVDMVVLTENEEGNKLVQLRLRQERIPEVGDKFASRHGQKGIISYLVDSQNLPFFASGVTPDIIFSPHGMPSRMTMSHLIEILAGKAGAMGGEFIDGTSFDAMPEKEVRKMLRSLGFRENGLEMGYNGITGKPFHAKIFVGNIYYLKLKYMVANKLHARATGQIQLLTRQPIEGRALGGGLRIGEMEKDCFVAHGASLLLKERFDSDKTIMKICEECGMFGFYDRFKNVDVCPKCGSSNTKISSVELSYAFKLLMEELMALGVKPNFILENKY
jgi:DNA-directed RNA polymerase subunit B'